ncbi:MAG: hypothetical protein AAF960_21655 [Bacteroidota bacterium]
MREEKIKAIVENFEAKYRAWLQNQKGQENAYDYEKSYADFIREISRDTIITKKGCFTAHLKNEDG